MKNEYSVIPPFPRPEMAVFLTFMSDKTAIFDFYKKILYNIYRKLEMNKLSKK